MEGVSYPRVTLDDPDLSTRLRYHKRSPGYVQRKVANYSHIISDVKLAVRALMVEEPRQWIANEEQSLSQLTSNSVLAPVLEVETSDALFEDNSPVAIFPSTSQITSSMTVGTFEQTSQNLFNKAWQRLLKFSKARSEIVYNNLLDDNFDAASDLSRGFHVAEFSKSANRKRLAKKFLSSCIGLATTVNRFVVKSFRLAGKWLARRFSFATRFISKLTWKPALLYGAALLLLAVGIYVSVNGWLTNHQVAAQVSHLEKTASSSAANNSTVKAVANANLAATPPATTPISTSALASYQVAPTLPRYLIIPKIGVRARVLQTGLTPSGALGVPPNIYDTSWYTGSALPGQPGATLIDGHLDGAYSQGVFWNLHKLGVGDTLQIQRGDGTMLTYYVVKTQTFDVNDPAMMPSTMVPITPGQPGLNLITCDGNYSTKGGYDQRFVVYASLAS